MAWEGSLSRGSGVVGAESSGAFSLPFTLASRVADPGGKTSPEELLAAAHASCFSMAFASGLAKAGTPAERFATSARVTFIPGSGITKIALEVRGTVPGLDENGFRAAAEDAKDGCPVSKALAGVPEITVQATLEK